MCLAVPAPVSGKRFPMDRLPVCSRDWRRLLQRVAWLPLDVSDALEFSLRWRVPALCIGASYVAMEVS